MGSGRADKIEIAVRRLQALQRADGSGLTTVVRATAEALAVSERTVWRWLTNGPPARPTGGAWEPTAEDLDAYVRWKGNAAAA